MKNKYKQRLLMAVLSIVFMISFSANVLADEDFLGQQTISNKGTYYRAYPTTEGRADVYVDGPEGGTWHRNHDINKPLPITVRNDIPLTKGTTGSKLSFKEDDIRNYGKAGDLFNNGHSNVKNGQDLLDKTGDRRSNVLKYTDHGIVTDKNGNVTHGYTVETMITPKQLFMSSLPEEVLREAKTMTSDDKSPDAINARYETLLAIWRTENQGTHNNPPKDTLFEMAKNPQLFKNSVTGMLQTVAVVEVTETDKSRVKEPTPNSGPGSCPTEFEALRSRREYLYTDYTTTDLPTPPTRNHGGCPSQDNEGFWNYTDEPAWGQNFFPVADEGGNKKLPLPICNITYFFKRVAMGNDI